MRDTTEKSEDVKAGILRLVGTDEEVIYKIFKKLPENQDVYDAMSKEWNLYGDGHACEKLLIFLNEKSFNLFRSKFVIPAVGELEVKYRI